jgi:3-oxoadipate enol-lactonase
MTRFARLDALTLHYRLEGQGPSTLVFINSLGSDLRIWDAVAAHFAAHFQILRYDKRGHGLSDAPTGPYTLEDHREDLRGLLEHLGIPKAILVGISVGGMIALDFALHYPERTQALVLCDTGARIGSEASWDERIAAIREKGLAEVARSVIARWFTPDFFAHRPAEAAGYYNMLSRTPTEGYIGTCAALREGDLRPRLKAVRAAALVLCGEADASTPPAMAQELASALGARLELIPQAAHLPCIEQPERLSQHIRSFLREQGHG